MVYPMVPFSVTFSDP